MFEKMSQSEGKVIGYRVVGTITKDDYAAMVPDVEALVKKEGKINFLLDMTQFKWEKVSAWGADWGFGREFRNQIERLAIVGDKKWEKWLTKLAEPFYAGEGKYFTSAEMDDAWDWLSD
jgi:hypothetical protein